MYGAGTDGGRDGTAKIILRDEKTESPPPPPPSKKRGVFIFKFYFFLTRTVEPNRSTSARINIYGFYRRPRSPKTFGKTVGGLSSTLFEFIRLANWFDWPGWKNEFLLFRLVVLRLVICYEFDRLYRRPLTPLIIFKHHGKKTRMAVIFVTSGTVVYVW